MTINAGSTRQLDDSGEEMTTLSVRLPASMHERLREVAHVERTSMNALIREAVLRDGDLQKRMAEALA
jgi:predicted transcriptional regulator